MWEHKGEKEQIEQQPVLTFPLSMSHWQIANYGNFITWMEMIKATSQCAFIDSWRETEYSSF